MKKQHNNSKISDDYFYDMDLFQWAKNKCDKINEELNKMSNKDYIFYLLTKSNICKRFKDRYSQYKYVPLKIAGVDLEREVVESLCCLSEELGFSIIGEYKFGSSEKQRDYTIFKPNGTKILVSSKTGKIKGQNLIIGGSRMGSTEFKDMNDRINYMNVHLADVILSFIVSKSKCEIRYIEPKIFGTFKLDYLKETGKKKLVGKENYTHVNPENNIISRMSHSQAYMCWHHIPTYLLQKDCLIINY